MPGLHAPAIVRLLRRVDRIPDSGCWVWGGFTNPEGYCVLSNDEGVLVRGHRLAYEFLLSTEMDPSRAVARLAIRVNDTQERS